MKSKDGSMMWFPLYVDKWLFGSTRIELEADERSVWIDLLAMGTKDDGFIRANEGVPYPTAQIAGLFCVSEELVKKTLNKCMSPKINKITKMEDGTYYINNWNQYQLSGRQKRRYDDNNDEKDGYSITKSLKFNIINELKKNNIEFETEKVCESGRIDIFIKSIPPQIIEIKNTFYADQIRSGIRQLLEYGMEFPEAELCLAVPPGGISYRLKEKMNKYNIKLYKWTLCPNKQVQKDTIVEKSIEENITEQNNKKDISIHAPASRKESENVDKLLKQDWVLRLHNGEFEKFCLDIKQLIAGINEERPHNKFSWVPETSSFESDMRGLIYGFPANVKSQNGKDSEKEKILLDVLNINGQKMNWPNYVRMGIRYTILTSGKKKITSPFRFTSMVLKKPMDIVSAKIDGILSG